MLHPHRSEISSLTLVALFLAISSCVTNSNNDPFSNQDFETGTAGENAEESGKTDGSQIDSSSTKSDSTQSEENSGQSTEDTESGGTTGIETLTSNGETTNGSTTGDPDGTDTTETSTSEDTSDTTTSEGTADTGSETEDCPSVTVDFASVTPTVVLLIDQSGSMNQDLQPMLKRWDAVENALFNPTNGVVTTLDEEIRFGMQLYTSDDGTLNGKPCPLLTGDAPAIGNYSNLNTIFSNNTWQGDTPTGDSIAAVATTLVSDPGDGPKIIVLATDGEPDTCAEPNPQNGQGLAVQATEQAFTDGISTFIISVGADVSDAHLQEMANAGIGQSTSTGTAPFYRATDQDALIDAFEEIINGVRSCVFTLDGTIVSGSEDKGTVKLNDQQLIYDDPNGWQVVSPTQIELLGDSCHSIKEGVVEIDIEFPCDSITPQ